MSLHYTQKTHSKTLINNTNNKNYTMSCDYQDYCKNTKFGINKYEQLKYCSNGHHTKCQKYLFAVCGSENPSLLSELTVVRIKQKAKQILERKNLEKKVNQK